MTVTVHPVPTANINAEPEAIIAGGSTTLSWSSEHADTVTIEPDIGEVLPTGSMEVSPSVTTAYTIAVTGPGGTASADVTVTVHPVPTLNFNAEPLEIIAGDSTTLMWASEHADTVTIEPDIGEVSPTGSMDVSPSETTLYRITATGDGGTVTDTVTITVTHPVPTVSFSASPDEIQVAENTVLTWNTEYADSVFIEPDIGPVDPDGQVTVPLTATTTFTLVASGPGGVATATADVTVTDPNAPPSVSLTASPATISPGETATLTWVSTNADAAHLDNGIGPVAVDGSQPVSPEVTTVYTITVTGGNGSGSAQAVVNVGGAPESPPEGSFGEPYEDQIPENATIETYDADRFALVTGQVVAEDDTPIADVRVGILGHPEYGTAGTDTGGQFSLPVEGGGYLTVVYEKSGLITAHRTIEVPWNGIAAVPAVKMLAQDPAATTITFDNNPDTVIRHQSSAVTDEFGERSASMVFTGDNRAFLTDENGNDVLELTTITTRATEFSTPEAMPAELPPTSAYTYCVELGVDGAARVRFEKPVVVWVDNFLGFDVGEIVPVGYYDRDKGAWIAGENGHVVQLLGSGVVTGLDADGDGIADDLNNDGSTADEVQGLDDPAVYIPGNTYWRFSVKHFTPWDCNWPYGPPSDATPPNPDTPPDADQQPDEDDSCNDPVGSYVEARSRILHEDIPVPGTGIALHYSSNRVPGDRTWITLPASGDTVPSSLKEIIVKVDVAGQTLEQRLPGEPNQTAALEWDGLDHLGLPVNGVVKAKVRIGFIYDAVYYGAADFGRAFAQTGARITGVRSRQEVITWRDSELTVSSYTQGSGILADGWTLSTHHYLSLYRPKALIKGDGTVNWNSAIVIDTVAGSGDRNYSGDGGPALEAGFYPATVTFDAAGNMYIAEYYDHRIRKVDRDGIIATFAGTGSAGFSGDGGPAATAQLNYPWKVAADNDGNVYIVDLFNHRIRRVDRNGIITTFAGTGTAGFSGDGGLATAARLNYPWGIALDGQGNLYFADQQNHRIRKIDRNGIITTVAGNGSPGYSGDGGPARQARMQWPNGISLDSKGNIFFIDYFHNVIRKVDTTGIITTVAGNGEWDYYGDGGPATAAALMGPSDLEVDGFGNMFIADSDNYAIRRVDPKGIITTYAGTGTYGFGGDGGSPEDAILNWPLGVTVDATGNVVIVDTDNALIRRVSRRPLFRSAVTQGNYAFIDDTGVGHVISGSGRHLKTLEVMTGSTVRTFDYDAEGSIISMSDAYGNTTTLERDSGGVPLAIISPDGLRTELTIDANNHLTRISYPDGGNFDFTYTGDGLLLDKMEPEGNVFSHRFDNSGRVTEILDEEGGHWLYSRSTADNGDIVIEALSAGGDLTTYTDRRDENGGFSSTITDATGGETLFSRSADGLNVIKSLSCGMTVQTTHDYDPEYGYKYLSASTQSTPSGLSLTTNTAKSYQDTDADGIPDLLTESYTVNDDTSTIANDALTGTVTLNSPEGRITTVEYDPATLLTESSTTSGLLGTTFSYDARGRLTSAAVGSREMTYSYDSDGFLASTTNPENFTTLFSYDDAGRLTLVERPDGGAVAFSYDLNGNMTVLTTPKPIDHEFGFNNVNRQSDYLTPESGNYSFTYDRDRRPLETIFPSGQMIENTYENGRLVATETPEGPIAVTYYSCGNKVQSITKGAETISFGYDGRFLTSEVFSGTLGQSLGYVYNNDFRLTQMTYGGGTTAYSYDNDGLLTGAGSFTIARRPDNGLPQSVTGGTYQSSRTFNGYAEIESESTSVNGTGLVAYNMVRDVNGRITRKTETINGTSAVFDYAYDEVGRLLTVEKEGIVVEEYRYDLNGTRTYERNTLRGISGRDYEYNDDDHLLTAGGVSYQYDLDGFLTSRAEGSDITLYDYSSRGELLSVDLPDGRNIRYLHDPLGRRVAKLVNDAIVEKYLWRGLTRLLAVYDASNNLMMRFEYVDGRMPVAMTMGTTTYYLAYDQVGSLKAVSDANGNVLKTIDYDSFGNILSEIEYDAAGNIIMGSTLVYPVPFGFAGGLHDRDTHLVRFGYRDYDPDTGRWTAKDPIFFAGGDTDLYGYVFNDPISSIDPLGLFNPTKGFVALTNAANAGRLYASGTIKLAASAGLDLTGVGIPAGIGTALLGAWNISSATAAQERAMQQWREAMREEWSDASWKNLKGLLPHGQYIDDPCEPTIREYLKDKYEGLREGSDSYWDLVKEIGTLMW
ncbi:odd Oz/ten-m homolog 4 [Olavius algarvensis associated proteobacterium Delta 3]|nr:odd Oz/ten-m homolog 4 [Olavius algarvensis associated proteobacterium Delta 3]